MQVIHDESNKSTARSNIFTLDTLSITWIENRHLQQLLAEPLCDPQVVRPGTLCQPEHVTMPGSTRPSWKRGHLDFYCFSSCHSHLYHQLSPFTFFGLRQRKYALAKKYQVQPHLQGRFRFDKRVGFSKLTWNFGFGIFESRSMR